MARKIYPAYLSIHEGVKLRNAEDLELVDCVVIGVDGDVWKLRRGEWEKVGDSQEDWGDVADCEKE